MPDLHQRHYRMVRSAATVQVDLTNTRLTVPAGHEWLVIAGRVLYTATNVTNRRIRVDVYDDADNLMSWMAAGAQLASTSQVSFGFGDSIQALAAFQGLTHHFPWPPVVLEPGWYIEVSDDNSVDPTNDSALLMITVAQEIL